MSDHAELIEGRTGSWEIVLGLEVHAQVASQSKLFSGAAVGFGAGPNEQVSLVDAAFPDYAENAPFSLDYCGPGDQDRLAAGGEVR